MKNQLPLGIVKLNETRQISVNPQLFKLLEIKEKPRDTSEYWKADVRLR
jgi:hypothetical protein